MSTVLKTLGVAGLLVGLVACTSAPDQEDHWLVSCGVTPSCSEYPADYYVCTGDHESAEATALAACQSDLAQQHSNGICTNSTTCDCIAATVSDDCEATDLIP